MRRLGLSLMLAVLMLVGLTVPALAQNPTVTITVNAATVSITNSHATWNITALVGAVNVDDIVYFSATGDQDDGYSQIVNTGNVAVDIEVQGTNFEGGAYDWTLAAATGVETYSLYANNGSQGATYGVEVKSAVYNDICTSLAASNNWNWSMKFTAPSGFNGNDDGSAKTATVTLAVTQSPP